MNYRTPVVLLLSTAWPISTPLPMPVTCWTIYIRRVCSSPLSSSSPNKSDLQHQTKVDSEMASKIAVDASSQFAEVSAAEDFVPIHRAFNDLLREVGGRFKGSFGRKRRLSFRTVSKAIVAVLRNNKGGSGGGTLGDGEGEVDMRPRTKSFGIRSSQSVSC